MNERFFAIPIFQIQIILLRSLNAMNVCNSLRKEAAQSDNEFCALSEFASFIFISYDDSVLLVFITIITFNCENSTAKRYN